MNICVTSDNMTIVLLPIIMFMILLKIMKLIIFTLIITIKITIVRALAYVQLWNLVVAWRHRSHAHVRRPVQCLKLFFSFSLHSFIHSVIRWISAEFHSLPRTLSYLHWTLSVCFLELSEWVAMLHFIYILCYRKSYKINIVQLLSQFFKIIIPIIT